MRRRRSSARNALCRLSAPFRRSDTGRCSPEEGDPACRAGKLSRQHARARREGQRPQTRGKSNGYPYPQDALRRRDGALPAADAVTSSNPAATLIARVERWLARPAPRHQLRAGGSATGGSMGTSLRRANGHPLPPNTEYNGLFGWCGFPGASSSLGLSGDPTAIESWS
jgi:hypothetical protein